MEIENLDYFENEKRFFDEIKSIFHSFWRAIIWWKNKNLIKIADTSFKHSGTLKNIYELLLISAENQCNAIRMSLSTDSTIN